jgi:hypothetical protein
LWICETPRHDAPPNFTAHCGGISIDSPGH